MISRVNRFHGRASLRRMQQQSQVVRGAMLSLKYAPNNRRSKYRLAIVVSRKVSKSAVVRNRIRRRLYECVRLLSSGLINPFDLVLIVYDEKLALVPDLQLTAEVSRLFKKANLTATSGPNHVIVEAQRNT